jgi:diguanylate cyclase (GGDEF)-like protein
VKHFRFIVCCIVFVVISIAGGYGAFLYEDIWEKEQQLHLNDITNAQASAIERRLARSLSSTFMLSHQVRYAQGDVSSFNDFAAEIIRAVGGVSNLQLAPNGIIQNIYPLKGSEKAIGHNLLLDDKRKREAHLAIKDKKLTLAGPFELVQGGVAVIGRNPVFLDKEGEDEFWGFASALIYLDTLIDVTDLHGLESKGYHYQLTRKHPDTQQWEMFSQSEGVLDPLHVTFPIAIPNSEWKLTLSRPLPNRPLSLWHGVLVSLLIGLVLSILLSYILREPERLRAIVAEKTDQLNELAFYDVLTGLVNRRLFMQQLECELKLLQRSGNKAALMYLDLDDFKNVNDSLGHYAGDLLLVEVANRIKSIMRESDIICRLGGDEYAILMMNIQSADDSKIIADQIIQKVSEDILIEGRILTVGLSIGITTIPDDSSDLREMLNNADMALYESKRKGKNRATFFNYQLQQHSIERLHIERELKDALKNNELELYYQPIIRLDKRHIVMLEALLRWNHPEKGLLTPDKFIEVAEQSGLIIPMGDWVLEQACKTIAASVEQLEPCLPIAINVSAKQLLNPNFSHDVQQMLEKYSVDPAMIEMEITESTIMENMEDALKQLNQLKDLGCRFSIDDFGTGYSSLAQLKQLPVDTLKIDRSFVKDIEHDHHNRQIIEAVIAMAHSLGLSVVAEGVEDQYQLDFIDKAGCDLVQGYLFSKPVPHEKVDMHELIS